MDEQDSSFQTNTHHTIGSSFCQGGRKAMCLPPSPEGYLDKNMDEPYPLQRFTTPSSRNCDFPDTVDAGILNAAALAVLHL